MSWDITLEGAGPVEKHTEGGTYQLGGTKEASLNVTYNYTEVTKLVIAEWPYGTDKPFRFADLNGRRAGDTIPVLTRVVEVLGNKPYAPDYWAPTPGNAGHAASILLKWALRYPEATWRVS